MEEEGTRKGRGVREGEEGRGEGEEYGQGQEEDCQPAPSAQSL